jgi:hypothetical protein
VQVLFCTIWQEKDMPLSHWSADFLDVDAVRKTAMSSTEPKSGIMGQESMFAATNIPTPEEGSSTLQWPS